MKRTIESSQEPATTSLSKVRLVERNPTPCGSTLVNSRKVATITPEDLMELDQQSFMADRFLQATVNDKLTVVQKQIESLQEIVIDITKETKLNKQLNQAACNFVKKPGNVYHLYQRDSGQRYFSILSPEEWGSPPHEFMGSFYLQSNMSWKPIAEINAQQKSLDFLQMLMGNRYKELMNV